MQVTVLSHRYEWQTKRGADWPTAAVLMIRPPGFAMAAIIGLAAMAPPFFLTVVYASPFLVAGL